MATLTRATSADEATEQLERDGCTLVTGAITPSKVQAVRDALSPLLAETAFGDNSFVGHRTKRIHSLFGRTRAVDELAVHPLVLEAVDRVVGDVLLSASVAIEIHPGENAQTPHFDDGVYPLPQDFEEIWVSALWAIDDFTLENGATVVQPGSHGNRGRRPDDIDEITVEMPAGSVLLYSGRLWHHGGANRSDASRLGIVLSYAASWLRPQDTHLISVPIDLARTLDPRLRDLLGYAMRPPFHGYVDGRDPRELFG